MKKICVLSLVLALLHCMPTVSKISSMPTENPPKPFNSLMFITNIHDGIMAGGWTEKMGSRILQNISDSLIKYNVKVVDYVKPKLSLEESPIQKYAVQHNVDIIFAFSITSAGSGNYSFHDNMELDLQALRAVDLKPEWASKIKLRLYTESNNEAKNGSDAIINALLKDGLIKNDVGQKDIKN